MKIEGWDAALDRIEEGIEGDAYALDLMLASGDWLRNYAVMNPRGGVVELVKDGETAAFLDLDAIVAVRLCA